MKRALRLHRRKAFVPEHDLASRGIGDLLRELPRGAGRLAFASFHVERQPHDETLDVLLLRQGDELGEQLPLVAPVDHPARMRQHAQLIGDGDSNAHASQIKCTGFASGHAPKLLSTAREG